MMKNIAGKIALLLTILITLGAQTAQSQNFRLGFQGNPSLSWLSANTSEIAHKSTRMGIDYGIVADIYLSGLPRYSVNTGLLISNQAFNVSFKNTAPFQIGEFLFNSPVDVAFRLNYLQVPTNIKLKTDQFHRTTAYGQFGLTSYFNLNAKGSSSDGQMAGHNINNAFKLYYAALLIGAGAEYEIANNTSILLGLQYSKGLTDATKFRNLNEKSMIQRVLLTVGVLF